MRVNTVTVAGRLMAPADQGGPPERPWGRLRVDVGISKPRELTVWVYGELLPIAAALRSGDEVLVHGQLREHPERDELAVVAAALGAADAPPELGEAEPFEDPEPMIPERELIGAGGPQLVPGSGVQAIADRIMQRASGHQAGEPRPARAG